MLNIVNNYQDTEKTSEHIYNIRKNNQNKNSKDR